VLNLRDLLHGRHGGSDGWRGAVGALSGEKEREKESADASSRGKKNKKSEIHRKRSTHSSSSKAKNVDGKKKL
jgi:hypothetical protein